MRPYRPTSHHLSRWIVGPFILVGAILAFALYQGRQIPSVILPRSIGTNTPAPTANTNPAATRSESTVMPTAAGIFQQPAVLKLLSDKAGITAEVTELYLAPTDGWDLSHLDFYAGHLEGTPALGQGGNFVLAGHVELKDGTPGPFAHLDKLSAGDTLLILKLGSQSGIMRYTVTEVKSVPPDDFGQIRNHGYEELTLITCGDWSAQDRTYHTRVVVHARPANATL